MIDIHTHILPGVDDGAKTNEEALKMLELSFEQGITRVVLTPHVQNRVQKVSSRKLPEIFHTFKSYVSKHLPAMKLFLGAEVKYEPFKEVDYSRYLYDSQKYILMEFSVKIPEPVIDEMYNLTAKGFQPILAHAERYQYLTFDDYHRIKQDGALIQVNTDAILGLNGLKMKKRAFKMIKEGLVDLIASDAHDTKVRKPNLMIALKKIEKIYDIQKLKEFTYE